MQRPIVKPKKDKPCKIDEFMAEMTQEQIAGLMLIANRPNPKFVDIQVYFQELGYKLTINAVSTWYSRFKEAGQKALIINQELVAYRGLDSYGILEKIIADTIRDIDLAVSRVELDREKIESEKFLQALPNLRKTAVGAIEAFNRLGKIQEKEEIELAGMLRMATGLKEMFKNSPFAEALNEGIKAVLAEAKQD